MFIKLFALFKVNLHFNFVNFLTITPRAISKIFKIKNLLHKRFLKPPMDAQNVSREYMPFILYKITDFVIVEFRASSKA